MCPRQTALMVKAIHSIKGLLSRTVEHLMEEEQEEQQFSSLVTKKSSSIISTLYVLTVACSLGTVLRSGAWYLISFSFFLSLLLPLQYDFLFEDSRLLSSLH